MLFYGLFRFGFVIPIHFNQWGYHFICQLLHYYSKEEPKGVDCLEAFQKMQDCMKDYPELYDKENDGMGANISDSDSDLNDMENTGDIKAENKDSVSNAPVVSETPAALDETRTHENLSDTPNLSTSSNNSDKNDNNSHTESSQASRSQETEVLATGEASTDVDVQNKVTDSISSMSLSTNDSQAESSEN